MSLKCPRCNSNLSSDNIDRLDQNFSFNGVEVDICESCKGIWFDKDELQGIEEVIEPVLFEIRKIPNLTEQLIPLKCPRCEDVQLLKVQSERDKKVITDVCPECDGVWLDGGELEAIQKENVFKVLWDLHKWMSQ